MRSITKKLSRKSEEDLDRPYTFNTSGIPEEALAQDTYWYDRRGKMYRISQMNGVHARNAAKYLARAYYRNTELHQTPLMKALLDRAAQQELWARVQKEKKNRAVR